MNAISRGVLKPKWLPIWEHAFSSGDTVLDIGAHVGALSVHMALLGGVVHAFEGSRENAAKLRANCFGVSGITIHNRALSSVNQKCRTAFNDCADNIEQDVDYVRYDDYAKAIGIPDPRFVKMDIEGMETVALHGMRDLLERVRPTWQIEYHKGLEFRSEHYPGFVSPEDGGFDLTSEFARLGYEILDEDLQPVTELVGLENYFFIPR